MDQENRSDCRQPFRDVLSFASRYKEGQVLQGSYLERSK